METVVFRKFVEKWFALSILYNYMWLSSMLFICHLNLYGKIFLLFKQILVFHNFSAATIVGDLLRPPQSIRSEAVSWFTCKINVVVHLFSRNWRWFGVCYVLVFSAGSIKIVTCRWSSLLVNFCESRFRMVGQVFRDIYIELLKSCDYLLVGQRKT